MEGIFDAILASAGTALAAVIAGYIVTLIQKGKLFVEEKVIAAAKQKNEWLGEAVEGFIRSAADELQGQKGDEKFAKVMQNMKLYIDKFNLNLDMWQIEALIRSTYTNVKDELDNLYNKVEVEK